MFYINLDIESETRYNLKKFVQFENDVARIMESYFITELMKLPLAGTYVVQEQAGKPELLSYDLYRTTQYWWILLCYNELIEPADLIEGMIIKYPAINALERIYFQLLAKETAKVV